MLISESTGLERNREKGTCFSRYNRDKTATNSLEINLVRNSNGKHRHTTGSSDSTAIFWMSTGIPKVCCISYLLLCNKSPQEVSSVKRQTLPPHRFFGQGSGYSFATQVLWWDSSWAVVRAVTSSEGSAGMGGGGSDLLPNSLTWLLAGSLQGCLTTWQLASSRASDPGQSKRKRPRQRPQSFYNLMSEVIFHPSAILYLLESNQ